MRLIFGDLFGSGAVASMRCADDLWPQAGVASSAKAGIVRRSSQPPECQCWRMSGPQKKHKVHIHPLQ